MNAAATSNRLGAVAGAFAWLQAVSFYNRLRQRLLRLRQPKYLFGAIAGGAYFYFFLVRRMLQGGATAASHPGFAMTPALAAFFATLAALALAVIVLVNWLFSGESARLTFTEAEIAFLFPAPISRTTLIQLNLLRSQLGIFFSSFLLSLLLRRGAAFGTSPLQYATGIWLLLSMLNLHLLAASFTRERLLGLGLRPWLRNTIAVAVLVLAALACWWRMRGVLHWPSADALSDGDAMRAWFEGIVGTAPLSWLLVPFRWVVAPIFATDGAGFMRALAPALALLVVHYVWVLGSQVSFEEATIAHARRRAERVVARREGRIRERAPTTPRSEPFRLAAAGFAPTAFFWKGLIEMGPFYRLRTWVITCAFVFALCQWLAADPARLPILLIVGVSTAGLGAWLLVMVPMMMQRGLRRTIEHMDILKASPLRGWQIALGELLTPTAVMSFAAWLLALLGAELAAHAGHAAPTAATIAAGTVGLVLIAPPLSGLMLCVPFAGLLYFPAWTASPGDGGGRGVEVMGQRLIFMGGYLVTLVLSAIPAALLGGLGYLLGNWIAGPTGALLVAAVFACATLAFELACAVDLLGRRIDRFDVSQELR